MFSKFISKDNFAYIWGLITKLFVRKEDGKGLSSNDYTDEDKKKLNDLEVALDDKIDSSVVGVANGIATLDNNGKIPQSQLPNSTSAYETIIINAVFDENLGIYSIDEYSATMLRNYSGEKTMFLYEPTGQLYIPYIGNNEFVIDVFGSSLYFHVNLDTLICDVSIGEWVSLDENGEISEDKLPGIIVHGYYNSDEGLFYEDKNYEVLIVGSYKKFFVDIRNNELYSYNKGKYHHITTVGGNTGVTNIEYLSDEEYEALLGELGI